MKANEAAQKFYPDGFDPGDYPEYFYHSGCGGELAINYGRLLLDTRGKELSKMEAEHEKD